ncbi:MAG TPA: nicotinate (nicotinamide) nucleotide adenylyltransferase [Bacteroidia bacterium]|nr:nicotinate (nicotinamide) nucleotide adenylyltransferase [Bacteroidia bacterium]HRH09838.1 nicotinate (nicotinamide) nucleotide adenylyltransferase [Bacteroidia bacterium]
MKIGLFFGSFNPVHIGHLVIANYMAQYTDLQKVWLVISPHNPLKEKSSLLDDKQRLALVKIAIENNSKLKASDIEFKLPQPSYTITTLVHLKEKYPEHEFALIMGSDNLSTFHKWKNYEEILKYHTLYIYPRPKHSGEAYKQHSQVKFVDAPVMEISSTFIRQAIADKKDVRYLLPDNVYEYVKEMHFYKKRKQLI